MHLPLLMDHVVGAPLLTLNNIATVLPAVLTSVWMYTVSQYLQYALHCNVLMSSADILFLDSIVQTLYPQHAKLSTI